MEPKDIDILVATALSGDPEPDADTIQRVRQVVIDTAEKEENG